MSTSIPGTPASGAASPGISSTMSSTRGSGGMRATATGTGTGLISTKDSRASEAIAMKDEQLKILQEQNR
jgi:hypothetical protein